MMAINIPQEIFYQIALHLPSIRDILAFSLTNSRVRETLLTPALFKNRLALRWDMSAWKDDEDDRTAIIQSTPRYLERWMRIEYIYDRVVELFDEAAVDNYFAKSPLGINVDGETQPDSERLVPGSFHDVVTPQLSDRAPVPPRPTFDEQKAIIWLRKLSKVLPVFLTHHRGTNVSKIVEARYHRVVLTFAKVLSSVCVPKDVFARVSGLQALEPKLAMSEYAWFERISFSLTALLIQCDTDTSTSIFSDTAAYTDPPSSAFRSFMTTTDQVYTTDTDPYALVIAQSTYRVSERHLYTFLIQSMILMTLCSDTSLPLRAPWIPYINPAASSSYDNLMNLTNSQEGTDPLFLLLPPTRPWLRSKLAGTPLTELLSSAVSESNAGGGRHGRFLWAGYYTIDDKAGLPVDPPMFLELFSLQGPNALPSNANPDPFEPMHFRGEGHDAVGLFTLKGSCEYSTGAVRATKSYATHEWKWQGTATPFGMAGIWYNHPETRSGWWWIWPEEWSNNPATIGAD